MMQLKHIQNHCFSYYLDVFFINLTRLSFFTALKPKSLQWPKRFYAPWPLWSYLPGFFLPSPQLQPIWPLLFLWKCQTSSCLSTCAFAVPGMLFPWNIHMTIPSPLSGLSPNINLKKKAFCDYFIYNCTTDFLFLSFLIYRSHGPFHYLTDFNRLCIFCVIVSPALKHKPHEGRVFCVFCLLLCLACDGQKS